MPRPDTRRELVPLSGFLDVNHANIPLAASAEISILISANSTAAEGAFTLRSTFTVFTETENNGTNQEQQ